MLVGRDNVINQLKCNLFAKTSRKLTIIPVEGPGGIGKTTIIDTVISMDELSKDSYLYIALNGRSQGSHILSKLYHASQNVINQQLPSKEPYFSLTEKAMEASRQIESEISRYISSNSDSDKAKDFANTMVRVGVHLMSRLDVFKVPLMVKGTSEEDIEKIANDLIQFAQQLQAGAGVIGSFKKLVSPAARIRDRLLNDFEDYIAECFYIDLACILQGWIKSDKKRFGRLLPKKCKEFNKLFLYIDDFESFQNNTGVSFFFEKLLPRLEARASFQTVLLLSTRDEISVDSRWAHKYGQMLDSNKVVVGALSKEDTEKLVRARGGSSSRIDEIYRESDGNPLYIELYLKELQMANISAHHAKQFYDRITQWMDEQEKEWFNRICYLEVVNIETIPQVFNDVDMDARRIFHWFQNEGSVRDTRSSKFQVRPFVRDRVLRYLKIVAPSDHEKRSRIVVGSR